MIEYAQIEITTACNAACGECIRQKLQEDLQLEYMSIDVFKRLINDLSPTLKTLNFEGNYGDSPIHPQFLEMVEYAVATVPNLRIEINTNASYKKEEFWFSLGKIIRNTDHIAKFDIDGIDQESHSYYRASTDFDKVIKNAKAFISAGGNAQWKMLPLEYNAKYETEAKNLSEEYGFKEFRRQKTSRFYTSAIKEVISRKMGYISPIDNSKDQGIFYSRYVEPLEKLIDFDVDPNLSYTENKDKFYSKLQIPSCPWQVENRIQISGDSTVWQCCHTEMRVHKKTSHSDYVTWKEKYERYYGENWNSLKHHSLNEILKHQYFSVDLMSSFEKSFDDDIRPKLKICAEKCGIVRGWNHFDKL